MVAKPVQQYNGRRIGFVILIAVGIWVLVEAVRRHHNPPLRVVHTSNRILQVQAVLERHRDRPFRRHLERPGRL